VIAYVGQTRSRDLIAQLAEHGIGECTVRGELPPRRRPWFFDNGAFRDFTAGRAFDREAFERDVARIREELLAPDFLVLPDVVAGGRASLDESLAWAPRLEGVGPLYLAVQDGMSEDDVRPVLGNVAGVFVGGSTEWKLATAAAWRALAHAHGRRLHVGRVGSMRRVAWARLEVRADSIDSCLPLWSAQKLDRFVRALVPCGQGLLFGGSP